MSDPPIDHSVDGWFPLMAQRFVRRDGRYILQQGWARYDNGRGRLITEWRDVPLEDE